MIPGRKMPGQNTSEIVHRWAMVMRQAGNSRSAPSNHPTYQSGWAAVDTAEELELFGLVLEPFGPGAVIVREVPALVPGLDLKSLIRDLADELEEWGDALALQERIEHVCGTLACHSSVRAGRHLVLAEMDALLRQMEATPNSGQCNHGRPTYVSLALGDIERLFGRR